MAKKQIPIDSLTPGMYIVNFDRPWIDTPFLTHRFLIKSTSQLQKIQQAGIRFVEIDTDLGRDIGAPTEQNHNSEWTQDTHPRIEDQFPPIPQASPGAPLSAELATVRANKEQVLQEVKDLLKNIRTAGVVDSGHAKEVTQEIINHTIGHEEACAALIRTRDFSPDLYEHSLSVCTLAVLLGSVLKYDKQILHCLAMGALLHDVGLLCLPAELVRPVRSLSTDDLQRYHQHPELGLEMLKKSQGISDEVKQIVAEHHHTLSPNSKEASHPPQDFRPTSRLIRVVDEYDELLSGQGIKGPLSVKEALGMLYHLGQEQLIDLQIVSHFIAQIGIFPLYSLVELNTGERGIVTAVSPGDLLHPIVLLFQDSKHQTCKSFTPINFASLTDNTQKIEIVSVLDAEKEGINVEEILSNWVTV